MLRWAGDRYCVLDMDGKEVMHNVNRLVRHHVWDEAHPQTDTLPEPAHPGLTLTPTPGMLVVFPTTYNEQHKCLFGVGRVIEVKGPNDVHFQWFGNKPLSEASKAFAPGWVDPRDNKGSTQTSHTRRTPWTNRDTATSLAVSAIIAQGEILATNGKVNVAVRGKIEATIGNQ